MNFEAGDTVRSVFTKSNYKGFIVSGGGISYITNFSGLEPVFHYHTCSLRQCKILLTERHV